MNKLEYIVLYILNGTASCPLDACRGWILMEEKVINLETTLSSSFRILLTTLNQIPLSVSISELLPSSHPRLRLSSGDDPLMHRSAQYHFPPSVYTSHIRWPVQIIPAPQYFHFVSLQKYKPSSNSGYMVYRTIKFQRPHFVLALWSCAPVESALWTSPSAFSELKPIKQEKPPVSSNQKFIKTKVLRKGYKVQQNNVINIRTTLFNDKKMQFFTFCCRL